MKTKKLIVLTLLALLLVPTMACGSGGEEANVTLPATMGYLTYTTDEVNGFSISHPENWDVVQQLDTPEKTIVAFVDPRFCCAVPSGVSIVKEAQPEIMSVREYFEAGKAMLANTGLRYTSISEEQATLSGRIAIKHVYTLAELSAKQMDIYLVESSTGWVITCSSIRELWYQYESIFDTMMGSFRLLD